MKKQRKHYGPKEKVATCGGICWRRSAANNELQRQASEQGNYGSFTGFGIHLGIPASRQSMATMLPITRWWMVQSIAML
jgi:hypothetical protein